MLFSLSDAMIRKYHLAYKDFCPFMNAGLLRFAQQDKCKCICLKTFMKKNKKERKTNGIALFKEILLISISIQTLLVK